MIFFFLITAVQVILFSEAVMLSLKKHFKKLDLGFLDGPAFCLHDIQSSSWTLLSLFKQQH